MKQKIKSKKKKKIKVPKKINKKTCRDTNVINCTDDKSDKTISKIFYMVSTENRTFYSDTKEEVVGMLEQDEENYEITSIEYIGNYKGMSDVIHISNLKKEDYLTYIDAYSIVYFIPGNETRKESWRTRRNASLEIYYNVFKNRGLKLSNDVYQREKNIQKAINVKLKLFVDKK